MAKKKEEALKITADELLESPSREGSPRLTILGGLIEASISCHKVHFQTAVNSPATDEPEFIYYNAGSHRKSRTAEIYYSAIGVILVQGDKLRIVPLPNVKEATPL